MPTLTNKYSLPEPLVAAIRNDPYDRGDCDISVTQLLKPPRMVQLERERNGEIEEDASTRIWALMGQLGHAILERASDYPITEKRLTADILGWKISGQIDVLPPSILTDYKFTTVWSCAEGLKAEWIQQLNMLKYLCDANTIPVEKAQIVAIYRDWSTLESKRNGEYPQSQVQVFDIPIWDIITIRNYIEQRVIVHQLARKDGADSVTCSADERWEKPTTWAVMKDGNKKATSVWDTQTDAEIDLVDWQTRKPKDTFAIIERPGECVRCTHYCAVAQFCKQWQSIQDL